MRMKLFPLFVFLFITTFVGHGQAQAQQEQITSDVTVADDYSYSPMGRRDPFRPLVNKQKKVVKKVSARPEKVKGPLEKFELNQFRLMAIMVIKGDPRAMVKAPDGKSYTVRVNDYIGMNDGRVKGIETKVVEVDSNGMRVEKSPDRIVVEEKGVDPLSGSMTTENRYIVM